MFDIKIERIKKPRSADYDLNNVSFGKVFSDHIFIADYVDGQWKDCRIESFGNFSIHPANMAWHYGQSIFEGLKAYRDIEGNPILFRPDENAKRFNESAQRMCMPEVPTELFLDAIKSLVDIDRDWIPTEKETSLYIRPFMFATDEFIGVRASETYKFVVFTCPVGPYYSNPVSLYADDKYARATFGGVGEAKTAGNYAASLYPAKICKEKGYDQVMWLDSKEFKYAQEVGTMNLFFVIDGKVVTPSINGAILKGITRKSIIQVLIDKDIEVEERNISINEIIMAHNNGLLQEIFGAGTAAFVTSVYRLGYQGNNFDLDTNKFTIVPMLKQYMEDLRADRVKDAHNWIVKLGQTVTV